MNRLKALNSVPFANRDIAPLSGTPQYATDGNPSTSIPPTIWPSYAFNMLQDEHMAILLAAGVTPDDANWAQMLEAMQRMFRVPTLLSFTATTTWTVPAGVYRIHPRVWGGGGGGGGSSSLSFPGGGGGGGGHAEGTYAVTPAQVLPITVAASVGAGVNGGSSSVGSLITATGGLAGAAGTSGGVGAGGAGGSSAGGLLAIGGGVGSAGIFYGSGTTAIEGGTGGAAFGGGVPVRSIGNTSTALAANGGSFPGGGSTGCTGAGANGAAGYVILEY